MGRDRSERTNVGTPGNEGREKDIWLEGCAPVFFVSASKWLSQGVSLLFATLAGGSISVASKGLRGANRW